MNRTTLAAAGTVAAVVALIATVVLLARPSSAPAPEARPSSTPTERIVREESHRLSSAPAGSPVFVEFLDLECEACRAIGLELGR